MGFVVEPYAFFLFYEVADQQRAAALLPEGFRLCKASVFEGDRPAVYAVFGFFRVHTSAFWGARAECYLMAEDMRTGLLSWVIVDYLSDTISYDRAHGLRAPSAPRSVVTTTCDGRVLVDVQDAESPARAAFDVPLEGAEMRPLDRRFWVEGNLSVGYGRPLSADEADVFSLTFLPEEMACALDVPLDGLNLECLTWHADLLVSRPAKLACFPFAQHVLSDSPGRASGYASERRAGPRGPCGGLRRPARVLGRIGAHGHAGRHGADGRRGGRPGRRVDPEALTSRTPRHRPPKRSFFRKSHRFGRQGGGAACAQRACGGAKALAGARRRLRRRCLRGRAAGRHMTFVSSSLSMTYRFSRMTGLRRPRPNASDGTRNSASLPSDTQ